MRSWKLFSILFGKLHMLHGEKSNPKNYRFISLSVINKVFESIINSSLTQHLDFNRPLSDHQYVIEDHCWRCSYYNLWTHSSVIGYTYGKTSAIALDISKAFDKVWNTGLIHKLTSSAYGISGQAIDMIKPIFCW